MDLSESICLFLRVNLENKVNKFENELYES